MSLCPNCQTELNQDTIEEGVCATCGHSLAELQESAAADESSETIHSGTLTPEQMARPRSPAPQLEKHVKKKLAATYDMEEWSSMRTLKPAGTERKPAAAGEKSKQDQDTRDTSKPTIAQGEKWVRPKQDIEEHAEISFQSNYELLAEVGRGGMGCVWKARQKSLQRDVALKIPYPADEKLDEGSKRKKQQRIEKQFVSEVLVTAKLDHPNIVPVHDMGQDEKGNRVFAMKLLKGNSWDQDIKRLGEDENLEILLKACDAIAFAHAQAVVHLDIKPENIWVGDFGEVSVVDWGVAVRFQPPDEENWSPDAADWNVAVDGLPGLTPAYAAPEMIDSVSRGVIGPTTDVYLLGAVLYEIITGKPPHEFTGRPMTDATKAWRNEILPTDKQGDLLNIAYRAMATESKHRYANVKALQDALRDYQSHRESRVLAANATKMLDEAHEYNDYQSAMAGFDNAISLWSENEEARRGSSAARLAYARAAKENQDFDLGLSILDESDETHAALAKELATAKRSRDAQARTLVRARWTVRAVIAASVVGLIFFSGWISKQNQENRDLAVNNANLAEIAQANADEADRNAQQANLNADQAKKNEQLAVDNANLATQNEVRANENAFKAEQRAIENAQLARRNKQIADEARRSELQAVAATRRVLEVSYRSKLGLAGETLQRNAFDVAKQMLGELEDEQVQRKLRHWEWGHLYSTTQNPVVRDFLSEKGKRLARVEAVDMSPNGNVFAAGTEDGKLYVWVRTAGELKTLSFEHGEAIYAVAVSPDGQLVASGGVDDLNGFVTKVWRLSDSSVSRLDGHQGPVLSVVFSRDASQLLTSAADGTARLWQLGSDVGTSRSFRGHLSNNVRSARFSPNENWIVTAGDDGFVHVWSREEGFLVKRFIGHEGPVYDAAFSSDGSAVVSGGYDRRLLVWRDVPRADEVKDFLKQYVADVERAVVQNERSQVPTTREFRILGRHDAAIRSVGTAGQRVFTASHDNTVRVWDLEGTDAVKTLRGHGGWVRSCRPAPDGDYVLSGGYDGRVRLWDWKRQSLPQVLASVADGNRPTDRHLKALAYSPDGRWIAIGSRSGQLTVWSMADGDQVVGQPLRQGHDWLATSGTYFQNGSRLLTTGGDNRAIIWDAERGTQLQQLGRSWSEPGGIGWYGVAAVSSDGKYVVTGSDQAETPVRLWDSRSGKELWDAQVGQRIKSAMSESKAITAAAFSVDADSSRMIVGGDDGRAWLLNRASGDVVHRLAGHTRQINAAAFSPDGRHVFTASSDGTVLTWSVDSGEQIGVKQHEGAVTALSISRDGRRLLTASRVAQQPSTEASSQPLVCCWDPLVDDAPLHKLPLAAIIRGHQQPITDDESLGATVRSAQLGEDGDTALITTFVRLAKGAPRYLVGDWDLNQQYRPFQQFSNISSATYAQGRKEVLVVGSKGAKLLTRSASEVVRRYEQPSSIQTLAFSRDSQRLAVGSRDGSIVVWQLDGKDWKPEFNNQPTAHAGGVNSVVFHTADDRVLLTAGNDGSFKVWQIDPQATQLKLAHEQRGAHRASINALSMATTSPRLLTVSDDGLAKIWDVQPNQCDLVTTLDAAPVADQSPIQCGALSADGRWALTGVGLVATVWDVSSGISLGQLRGHSAKINSAVFSHDSRRVLTASGDFTARVWDTRSLVESSADAEERSFDELLPLEEHGGEVNAALFSPTGQLVVSIGSDGQAIVWPAVKIEPSLNVPQAEVDYVVGDATETKIAADAQLLHPTMADFCAATLTVEIFGSQAAGIVEQLNAAVPEGFQVQDSTPQKLVIARVPSEAESGSLACMRAHAQWQDLLRSLTYSIKSDQPSDLTDRQILLQMDGIKYFSSESGDEEGLLDATQTIQIRLEARQSSEGQSIPTAPVSR